MGSVFEPQIQIIHDPLAIMKSVLVVSFLLRRAAPLISDIVIGRLKTNVRHGCDIANITHLYTSKLNRKQSDHYHKYEFPIRNQPILLNEVFVPQRYLRKGFTKIESFTLEILNSRPFGKMQSPSTTCCCGGSRHLGKVGGDS